MILTNCAACAAPLAHDAPHCVRSLVAVPNEVLRYDLPLEITLKMRWSCAAVLIIDSGGATLDALREVVTTLEDTEQTARRVLGGANPLVGEIETSLREARAALSAGDMNSISDAVGAL